MKKKMKAHGHHGGQSISVNGSRKNHLAEWKRKLAAAAEGIAPREFRPLKITREMRVAVDRCKELTGLPSLVR